MLLDPENEALLPIVNGFATALVPVRSAEAEKAIEFVLNMTEPPFPSAFRLPRTIEPPPLIVVATV